MSTKIISRAPARTCLFGDHQDYLNLPVIACAIDRYIVLEAAPNDTDYILVDKPDMGEKETFSIKENIDKVKGNHLLATMKVLRRHGCIPDKGYDVVMKGNIPINAGTSSSSAVVVAWANFLIEAFGIDKNLSPEFVAKIAYQAEVVEQDSPGGKMDQYSISLGNIIYLNTRDDFYEVLETPLEGLIVGESGIPKETIGLLSEMRSSQIQAIKEAQKLKTDFNVETTDINKIEDYLNLIEDSLRPFLKAAITNYHITREALVEFKKPQLDYPRIGDLMNQHHTILKDILKITVPLIDDMIEGTLSAGAYGAKIVGSGGGGSIVAIAPKGKESDVCQAIKEAKAKDAYPVSVDAGAKIIRN